RRLRQLLRTPQGMRDRALPQGDRGPVGARRRDRMGAPGVFRPVLSRRTPEGAPPPPYVSTTSRLRRRVFPGQLRRRHLLRALVLHVEARLATPGALEVVAHVEAQLAEPFGLELDHVTVLEGVEAAVVGAGRQYVAGLEGVDRADPLDAARDLVRHVVG